MTKRKALSIFCYIVFIVIFPFVFGYDTRPKTNGKIETEEEITQSDIFKILENKYLVSVLYYSDNFFEKIKENQNRLNSQSTMVLSISSSITNDFRSKYIEGLISLFPKEMDPYEPKIIPPLDHYRLGIGRNSHQDAIDLFTIEGTPVKSMCYGIVVLSEQGWLPDEPDKTVSNNSGNQVIIFNPNTKSFYRYCHLREIKVETGEIILAGQIIGTVGHSGLIASRNGHGEHLHLEINRYKMNGSVVCFSQRELAEMLKNTKKK